MSRTLIKCDARYTPFSMAVSQGSIYTPCGMQHIFIQWLEIDSLQFYTDVEYEFYDKINDLVIYQKRGVKIHYRD